MNKPRKKRSIIWAMPEEEFIPLVLSNNTLGKILSYFGLQNKGGNSKTLKARIKELQVDIPHIILGLGSNKGKKLNRTKIPLMDILVINSTYNRGCLKKRLIKEEIVNNECSVCKLKPEWQNKPLALILDHINGISNDNRLENLRLLCPNCNSQTSTFAGRNLVKPKALLTICPKCKRYKGKTAKQCHDCYGLSRRKIKRPDKQSLLDEVETLGYVRTGEKYGVSDNAIRKWLTRLDSNEDS